MQGTRAYWVPRGTPAWHAVQLAHARSLDADGGRDSKARPAAHGGLSGTHWLAPATALQVRFGQGPHTRSAVAEGGATVSSPMPHAVGPVCGLHGAPGTAFQVPPGQAWHPRSEVADGGAASCCPVVHWVCATQTRSGVMCSPATSLQRWVSEHALSKLADQASGVYSTPSDRTRSSGPWVAPTEWIRK